MTPAGSRGLRKAARDLFQAILAVVAGGGITAVVALITDSVSPVLAVVATMVSKLLVTYAQNYLETAGKIPAMLPSPGLVTAHDSNQVVGTVSPAVDEAGVVAVSVTNTEGAEVGVLTGDFAA